MFQFMLVLNPVYRTLRISILKMKKIHSSWQKVNHHDFQKEFITSGKQLNQMIRSYYIL